MAADSGVGSGLTLLPSTSAQNWASLAASPQSMRRPGTELLMVGGPFNPWGSDGGAAAVGGDQGAGDVAGAGRGQEGHDFGDLGRLGGAVQGGGLAEGVEQLTGFGPGVDGAGGDGVDADAPGAVLCGPAPGQRGQGGLGRAVGGAAAGQPEAAGHAADVDDAARPPGRHGGGEGGDQEIRRPDVAGEQRVELLDLQLLPGAEHGVPGVVHQDGDVADFDS